ncbi:uncharacterized protein CIMG_03128 [Coccidioides immitis RS]|uniref:Uncharacterized protein n=1 Tax=Coccidioides immitis (strain RS) TaxID=246410 RepID=J3KAP2_COCIM|nr:uncharacterized protein CIMG_03128 [Coccidioides immitis RS]EAS32104.3 hypothetical protein CIMG_03128 [Coccidioides immitis RS]
MGSERYPPRHSITQSIAQNTSRSLFVHHATLSDLEPSVGYYGQNGLEGSRREGDKEPGTVGLSASFQGLFDYINWKRNQVFEAREPHKAFDSSQERSKETSALSHATSAAIAADWL